MNELINKATSKADFIGPCVTKVEGRVQYSDENDKNGQLILGSSHYTTRWNEKHWVKLFYKQVRCLHWKKCVKSVGSAWDAYLRLFWAWFAVMDNLQSNIDFILSTKC